MKKIALIALIEILIVDLLALFQFHQPNSGLLLPAVFLFLFHGIVVLHLFNHTVDHFPDIYPSIRNKLLVVAFASIAGDLASLGLSLFISYWLVFTGLCFWHFLIFLSWMNHLHQQFPREFSKKLSYFDIL